MARPVIGLALGGGVARGWVHIGILRRLIAAGIEPDVVAGTSIGAVVGGLYMAGHLDAIEEWARSLTQRRLWGYFDVNWGGNSLISGERLAALLDERLGESCIEMLSRPFATVATELGTGHEFWLRRGLMSETIRASYALPGVFSPVKVDGRWLVDGALVNPCPTSVARALGARFVIAVSLHADLYGPTTGDDPVTRFLGPHERAESAWARAVQTLRPDRLLLRQLFGASEGKPSMTSTMLSALNILLDRVSRARLAGDPPDVLIAPRIAHIGLLDFHRAAEMIQMGEIAADMALPEIEERMALLG
ncbi:MAG: NTE family protein rssA [Alphaproteobacteria bacterium]|nr:NTE family protein rssA [Alphaproteobacteria bacterium]